MNEAEKVGMGGLGEMWEAEANIKILAEDAVHLEHLIAEYGENRSLGNVRQNVKAKLRWWLQYKRDHNESEIRNPEPLDMKDM